MKKKRHNGYYEYISVPILPIYDVIMFNDKKKTHIIY